MLKKGVLLLFCLLCTAASSAAAEKVIEIKERVFVALINEIYLNAEDYAGSGMSADELWEEIVCDSLGEINVFSTDLRAVAPELAELLEDVQGETLRNAYSRQGQNNTAAQEGGGRMSRVPGTERITAGVSDHERTELLKKRTLTAAVYI